MQNVVITGATGFVGGALAQALVDAGWRVTGVARGERRADLPIAWVTGDVSDAVSLTAVFQNADAVIHAAGMLGEAGVPEAAYHRLHIQGTRNVLSAVQAQAPQARVLYVSSPGVLGPIDGPPADETTPRAPSNAYERSKAGAEQVALEFAAAGLPLVIARPEFIYGPGDLHVLGLFRAVQRRIFFYVGNGRYTCHPTYIDDAVDGMLRCLQQGRPGEIYHITGPQPVTFAELAGAMAQALDAPPPFLTVPRPLAWLGAWLLEGVGPLLGRTPPLSRTGVAFFSENRRFDWQKAHRDLGYTPQVNVQEGARRTVAWYRERGLLD